MAGANQFGPYGTGKSRQAGGIDPAKRKKQLSGESVTNYRDLIYKRRTALLNKARKSK